MSEAMMKGTTVQPHVDWIRARYGEETWQAVLVALPESHRAQFSPVFAATMYPVSAVSEMCEALVAVRLGSNRGVIEAAFRDMGRSIAEASLTGVYSLFVRMATPAKILGRFPRMIGTMIEGASAECVLGADGHSAVVRVRGLGDLAYAGPRFCGWAEGALTRAGASNIQAAEASWAAGAVKSPELVVDVRWS